MSSNYPIMLNEAVKKFFLNLETKNKTKLREKFEYLENGMWDSGIRVKKLKGQSGKMIFEARMSKGDRMLFTLGRHGDKKAVYVWGIIKHDDIKKKADNIIPDNAPFLNFQPEFEESFQELSMDELGDRYITQEVVEERVFSDYGPQKWLVLNDDEWRRILVKTDPDNFDIFLLLTKEQEQILSCNPPVLISGTAGSGKTTISVYYLLRDQFKNRKKLFLTYNTYLKKFSQRLYEGLVANTELGKQENQPDFLVFKELLKKIIEFYRKEVDWSREVKLKEFRSIFYNHSLAKKYDAELVWEEIRAIIKGAKPPINVVRFKNLCQKYYEEGLSAVETVELKNYLLGIKNFEFFSKIMKLMGHAGDENGYDSWVNGITVKDTKRERSYAFLVEIYNILKKRADYFSKPLLSFHEYMMLGKKRAPNFQFRREDIYSIAEYYQMKLSDEKRWDEIDLCRTAIELLERSSHPFQYDLIVCDEVQDFTDIQIYLILSLVTSFKNILFSGDPKQIINPSGFRWEEVKDKFYEREITVPDIHYLNLNFRCVGNIVILSNALLDLKQKLTGLTDAEQKEDWKFNGKPPCLIFGITEKEMLQKISITHAGQIILVRSEGERDRLKQALGTELIFTIHEAKGLEFDSVLLWRFTSSDKKALEIWRKIKNQDNFDRSQYPFIKHELNMLYVAITRARNTLIIYDGENSSDIWDVRELKEFIYRSSEVHAFTALWSRISSPDEWEKQGDYFFEREYYAAAMECYKNADKTNKFDISHAYLLESKRSYLRAAQLFGKHGILENSARNYELAEEYKRASEIYQKLKNKKQAQICLIRNHEKCGDYNSAADGWMKLKQVENAVKNWEKAKNYQTLGSHFLKLKNYKNAAHFLELAGDYKNAAKYIAKERNFSRAAELYFKAGDYETAAVYFKKAKNPNGMINCYEKIEDYYSIGLHYENMGDLEKARKNFRNFVKKSDKNGQILEKEANDYYKKGRNNPAALRYSILGLHKKAAQLYYDNRNYRFALEEYKSINDWINAGKCYTILGDYYNYAVCLEKVEVDDKWTKILDAFNAYIYEGRKYNQEKARELFKEAEEYKRRGDFDRALVRYKAINYPELVYRTYLNLEKRDLEAIKYFMTSDNQDYGLKYLEAKQNMKIDLDFLKSIHGFAPANYWDLYSGKNKTFQLFIELCRKSYLSSPDEMKRDFIIQYYMKTEKFAMEYSNYHENYINLMMETRNYSSLFLFMNWAKYSSAKTVKKYKPILLKINKQAKETDDLNLLACYYYSNNELKKYDELLPGLKMSFDNLNLFVFSIYYKNAVEFYIQNGFKAKAINVAQTRRDFMLEGSIFEKYGEFSDAANVYRKHKLYEEALRCFKKINDIPNVARTLEKMGDYKRAAEIWIKLEKPRELLRIMKKTKMKFELPEKKLPVNQMKLF